MKKESVGIILFIFLLMLPFSSAQALPAAGDVIQIALDQISNIFGPIFKVLLGEYNGPTADFTDSEFFFMRILLLFLLIIILNAAVRMVPTFHNHRGTTYIISIIVSILAVRYMTTSQFVIGVLFPYGALGIALLTIFPFFLFFLALHKGGAGGFGRRLGWAVFMIFLLGFFITLWISGHLSAQAKWIYSFIFLMILLSIIFDTDIHRYFKRWEISRFYTGANQRTIAALQAEYLNIINVDSPAANNRRIAIQHQLRALGADIP